MQAAPATQPARPPQAFALIVGGNPGSPVYARRFADWLTRFQAYATATGRMPKDNVTVLAGDPAFKSPIVAGPTTATNLRQTLAALAPRMTADDQFVLFIVGHGTVVDGTPMLLLPGPDLPARDLADALDALPAKNQVILDCAGASGDFTRMLAKPGRVLVAATSPGEETEPVFAEFLLLALETGQADGEAPLPLPPAPAGAAAPVADPAKPIWRTGAKDGVVSVLEAYNWATHQTAMWTMRQKAVEDAWAVEGKESIALFKKLCVGDPGDPGARKLAPDSDASHPDAVIPLRMVKTDNPDEWWIHRRAIAEHALLEDCGQEAAASALRGAGYEPLDGLHPGEPGHRARRIVIGKPELLPVEGAP